MTKVIAIVVASVVLFFGLPQLIKHAISKQELHECITWKAQEQEIRDGFLARMESPWYSTDWQKEQCSQYGIHFNN